MKLSHQVKSVVNDLRPVDDMNGCVIPVQLVNDELPILLVIVDSVVAYMREPMRTDDTPISNSICFTILLHVEEYSIIGSWHSRDLFVPLIGPQPQALVVGVLEALVHRGEGQRDPPLIIVPVGTRRVRLHSKETVLVYTKSTVKPM